MATLAEAMAAHVVSGPSRTLSAAALDEAKTLVFDYFGVALRGSSTRAAAIVADYHEQFSARPAEATILGRSTAVTAAGAAYANAVAAHSLELDDTDPQSMLHFSAPVVSAALATAESEGLSGPQFLSAVVVGCEVMQAVSDGANPGMRDRGFHSTAVCGVFGAAAAAGIAFGLDEPQMVSALGTAGAHAAGLFEIYGPTMQKRLQPGLAAHNGVVSALLARFGFEGAGTVFDGRHGVFTAFTNQAHPDRALRTIAAGAPLGIEFKPYACFRPIHAAIDCALLVRARDGFDLDRIAGLTVYRHPQWASYHVNAAPTTTHEAQGSINHSVAVALADGAALLEQFAQDRLEDQSIRRLAGLLVVEVDEDLPRGDSCVLRAVMVDGTVIEERVDFPKGSSQSPMSPDEQMAKFLYLTGPLLPRSRAEALAGLIGQVERATTLDGLFDAARLD